MYLAKVSKLPTSTVYISIYMAIYEAIEQLGFVICNGYDKLGLVAHCWHIDKCAHFFSVLKIASGLQIAGLPKTSAKKLAKYCSISAIMGSVAEKVLLVSKTFELLNPS